MINLHGGETFQLQIRIHRLQRAKHVRVITERQRGMQAADDMQLGDAQRQRLARLGFHLLNRQLKTVAIAFLAAKLQNWQERMQ